MVATPDQVAICARFCADPFPVSAWDKVGIARETGLETVPINGLRHPPTPGVTGWYIWAGESLSEDPDFFAPLHVTHLDERCPEVVPYLALPPGWRFLLAPGYEDVWFDASLLAGVQDD